MSGTDPITEQDVLSFYTVFLGRRPESAEAVNRHLTSNATRADFLARVLKSDEFYRHNFRALSRYVVSGAPLSDNGPIQVECEFYELDDLFNHVQSVWSKLGEEQPHYSVLSTKQFAPGTISTNLDTFHESGRHEVVVLTNRLARLGLEINPNGTAVELGCGVGRVTRFLADHARKVVGYDVSPSHLAIAQDYAKEHAIANIRFEHLDQLASIDFAPHDFFYSRIVLQHNPPPVMNYLLDKMFSRTLPSGIVVFQVPTAMRKYCFNLREYLAICGSITDMELHCLPQAYVFKTMIKNGIMPIDVYRDGSLTGFDNVSTTFIGQKTLC